jgi:hypothetical protein
VLREGEGRGGGRGAGLRGGRGEGERGWVGVCKWGRGSCGGAVAPHPPPLPARCRWRPGQRALGESPGPEHAGERAGGLLTAAAAAAAATESGVRLGGGVSATERASGEFVGGGGRRRRRRGGGPAAIAEDEGAALAEGDAEDLEAGCERGDGGEDMGESGGPARLLRHGGAPRPPARPPAHGSPTSCAPASPLAPSVRAGVSR